MEPESRKKKWALTERQQVLLKEEIFVAFEKRDEKDGGKTVGKREDLSLFAELKKIHESQRRQNPMEAGRFAALEKGVATNLAKRRVICCH